MNDEPNGIGDSSQAGVAKGTEGDVTLVAIANPKQTRYVIEMAHVVGAHQLFLRIKVDLSKYVLKDAHIEAGAVSPPTRSAWLTVTAILSVLRMVSLILAFHQVFPLLDTVTWWLLSCLAAVFIGGVIARLLPPKRKL